MSPRRPRKILRSLLALRYRFPHIPKTPTRFRGGSWLGDEPKVLEAKRLALVARGLDDRLRVLNPVEVGRRRVLVDPVNVRIRRGVVSEGLLTQCREVLERDLERRRSRRTDLSVRHVAFENEGGVGALVNLGVDRGCVETLTLDNEGSGSGVVRTRDLLSARSSCSRRGRVASWWNQPCCRGRSPSCSAGRSSP